MNTTLTLITLALATTLTVQAREGDPERRRPGGGPIPPGVLKQFDKDGDGKLDNEEAKAARQAMQARREERREKMLAEFDTDKDGKLNEEERKAMQTAQEAKRKALVQKYDADKDGKLSRDEIKAARDAGEELPMLRPDGRRGERGEGRPPRGDKEAPAPPAGE